MPLKIERFQPEGMNVRMSDGQPSYSHVVTVSGTGKLVYIAGQLGARHRRQLRRQGRHARPDGTDLPKSRPLPEGGRRDLGGRRQDQHLRDRLRRFQKCGDVRMRYFGVATPTSTTVGVTRLAGPDFMIEIEAVAVVNG